MSLTVRKTAVFSLVIRHRSICMGLRNRDWVPSKAKGASFSAKIPCTLLYIFSACRQLWVILYRMAAKLVGAIWHSSRNSLSKLPLAISLNSRVT